MLGKKLPLKLRREEATLKYYYKLRRHKDNPVFRYTIPVYNTALYETSNVIPKIPIRANRLLKELKLTNCTRYETTFLYSIHNISTQSRYISEPNVNFDFAAHQPYFTVEFDKIIESHQEYKAIFTDGSKTLAGVGASEVYRTKTKTSTLPKITSIFTAELHAINLAINIVRSSEKTYFIILSDSFSILKSVTTLN